MLFPSWLGFCVLFCFCSCHASHHRIICIASRSLPSSFFNLHLLVVAASSLLLLTVPRPTLFFVSLLPKPESHHIVHKPPLVCASETSPNPNRVVVTAGSESSPNIYNTSAFLCWTLLSYLYSTVRFNRRVQI